MTPKAEAILISIIDKTKRIEEEISKPELKKRSTYLMKWRTFIDDRA